MATANRRHAGRSYPRLTPVPRDLCSQHLVSTLLTIRAPMPEVSVVVADVSRIVSIRDGLQLPGRVMHFTSATLASATVQPSSSTLLTSRAQPLGANLACLWLFIRSPGSAAEGFENPSFPNQERMNNLSERHS